MVVFQAMYHTSRKRTIGFKQYHNKKTFGEREIGKLIKDCMAANKMFRIWSQHPNCSPD